MSSFETGSRVRHLGTGKILLVISQSAFIERSSSMPKIPPCIPEDKKDEYSYVTEEANQKWVGTALNSRLVLISEGSLAKALGPSKKVVVRRTHNGPESCDGKATYNVGFAPGEMIACGPDEKRLYTVVTPEEYGHHHALPIRNFNYILARAPEGHYTLFTSTDQVRVVNMGPKPTKSTPASINKGFEVGDRCREKRAKDITYTVIGTAQYVAAHGHLPETTSPVVLLLDSENRACYMSGEGLLEKIVPPQKSEVFAIGATARVKADKKENLFTVVTKAEWAKETGLSGNTHAEHIVYLKSQTSGLYSSWHPSDLILVPTREKNKFQVGDQVLCGGNKYTVVSKEEYASVGKTLVTVDAENVVYMRRNDWIYQWDYAPKVYLISAAKTYNDQKLFPIGSKVRSKYSGTIEYTVVDRKEFLRENGSPSVADETAHIYLRAGSMIYWGIASEYELVDKKPEQEEQTRWPKGLIVVSRAGGIYRVISLSDWTKDGARPARVMPPDLPIYLQTDDGCMVFLYVQDIERPATTKEQAEFKCHLGKNVTINRQLMMRVTWEDYKRLDNVTAAEKENGDLFFKGVISDRGYRFSPEYVIMNLSNS